MFGCTAELPIALRNSTILTSALIGLGGLVAVPSDEKGTFMKCQFRPLIIVGNPGSGVGSDGEGSSPSTNLGSSLIRSGQVAALKKMISPRLGSLAAIPFARLLKSGCCVNRASTFARMLFAGSVDKFRYAIRATDIWPVLFHPPAGE